jgi:hypothetical protein
VSSSEPCQLFLPFDLPHIPLTFLFPLALYAGMFLAMGTCRVLIKGTFGKPENCRMSLHLTFLHSLHCLSRVLNAPTFRFNFFLFKHNYHEKLAAVVGGANTRVNWGLDNPKFSGRGTGARSFFRRTLSYLFLSLGVPVPRPTQCMGGA